MDPSPRPTALITGASSGIGLELARLLAKGGHDLVLVARNEAKLKELAQYLGGMYHIRVEVIPADLTDAESPEAILQSVAERGMRVDLLVNNAGCGEWGLFGRAKLTRQLEMIQLNISALTQLTRLVLPRMVSQRKGRILNVASTAAFAPGPLMAVYAATKAYVLSFSQAIAQELRGTGVTVTTVCPGPTRTGFAASAGTSETSLFSAPNVMDVEPVAQAAYRGLMRGRGVVVPGLVNKGLVAGTRVTPRWLLVRIARHFQERKEAPAVTYR